MSFRNYSIISRTIGEHDNNYTTEVVVVIIPFNGVCKLMHEWKGCNQCWNQHLINKISFCLRQFENQWPLFSWTSRISRPICFVSSCLLESLDLFIICFTVICIRLPKIHLLPYHLLSILIINKIHLLPYLLSILIINKIHLLPYHLLSILIINKIHLLPYHLLSILIINKIHLLPYLLSILIINKILLLPYHLLSILIINKIHLLPYLLSILIINKNTSTALSTLDSYHQ